MGLRELVRGQAAQAIGSYIGDIAQSITYNVVSAGGTYIPGSAPTQSVSSTTIAAALLEYEVEEVDNLHVNSGDRKVLIAGLTFEGAFPLVPEPTEEHTLTIEGEVWQIKSVMTDPAKATYTLQCRRPS